MNVDKLCTDYCYLCGVSLAQGESSVEHVVSRGLFGQNKGLIEVPAHRKCNNSLSKDDEYFRLCMAAQAAPHDPIARERWEGPIMRGFHRPDMPGLKKATLSAVRAVDIHTPAGIYLGTQDAMFTDAKRLHNVVNRITRGLYAYKTGKILALDWPVSSEMYSATDLASEATKAALEPLKVRLRPVGSGAFCYDWKYLEGDSRESFCWMVFYRTVHFWSFTGTKLKAMLSPSRDS